MHRRTKTVADVITYRMDFARALEAVWRPGIAYSSGAYVRPPIPNGFEYECTDAGQTAQDEPDWPTTIAATIADGSVVWTARDFASNASDTISSHDVTGDAGITLAGSAIDGTALTVAVSGGTAGQVYDLQFKAITASGDTYVETLRLTVGE